MTSDGEATGRRSHAPRRGRATAWALAAVVSISACSGSGDDDGATSTDAPPTSAAADITISDRSSAVTIEAPSTAGTEGVGGDALAIRLSDGAPVEQPMVTQVAGTPLTDAEVAAILDRLPDWVLPDDDRRDLNLPAESLPPPQVGDRIDEPFPAAGEDPAPEVEAGPLDVLRFQPEGAVELAPFLSVTFDQPMVPLGTLDQLDDLDVPVVVEPEIEGRWRWIGTRTLRFEVVPGETDRLPQATEYTVTVPAGTTSATGASLDEAVTWQFTTPATTVESVSPDGDALPLDPVWIIEFDQLIDPAAVLATTHLTAGDAAVPLRLATDDEIDADPLAAARRDEVLPGRWMAVTPTTSLAADTALQLAVGPDTPSLEGPRLSTSAQTYDMRTFAPLRVAETTCGWGDGCEPGMSWSIRFSNPLDAASFDREKISISPDLPGANVNVYDASISISGASVGQTTYTITLAADVADVYGQTLGEPTDVRIDVGPASPALIGFDRDFITLDPSAPTTAVSVTSINHDALHAEVWTISPDQYPEYVEYLEATYSDLAPPVPDWPLVLDEEVAVDGEQDRYVETDVDLSDAFEEPGDLAVVRISPTITFDDDSDDYWRNRPTVALVQSTGLGLDAMVSDAEVLVWTTDLLTGTPVADVEVEVLGQDRRITTDADGLATVPLAEGRVRGLVGRAGEDVSLLPSDWYDGWEALPSDDQTRWYVFDDMGVYRPGDTARLTGWVRDFTGSTDAQLALPAGADTVHYMVSDPLGETIAEGDAALNDLGGFNFSVDIPDGANLGEAWVELRIGTPEAGRVTGTSITIQEFRVPEFEVTARHESPAPYYAAEPAVVAVDAAYYAGGPLPNADVDWTVTSSTTSYAPPGWDDYTFGIWQPWWWFAEPLPFEPGLSGDAAGDVCFDVCPPGFSEPVVHEFSGVTDAQGSHYLQMDFDSPDEDQPADVSAVATVYDVNRQAWSSTTDVLVHPARVYVGIRTDSTFVEPGDTLTVESVLSDVDGAAVAGEATIEIGRIESRYVDGEWIEEVVDPTSCTATVAVDRPGTCETVVEIPGEYRVTATTVDRDGRSNRSELTRWVSGEAPEPTRGVERDEVTIIPDAEEYQPGDRAELLVQAPFTPASGRLTVLRNGIVTTEVFEAPDGSAVLEIPIEDRWIPNVTVQVDMTGSAPRTDDGGEPIEGAPPRPAYATGSIDLSIPPIPRTLAVDVTPATSRTEPGTVTTATVTVTDADGAPVAGADVAVLAVDEAVLSLTGYDIGDPIEAFYASVYSNVFTAYARQSILLGRPGQLAGVETAGGGEEAASEDGGVLEAPAATAMDAAEESATADSARATGPVAAPIELRADFDPVALYETDLRSGPDGTVDVDVDLPDNLTRYRLTAVAVEGTDRFGTGEGTLTARLPLMVRPSAPRFLHYGDAFELPVIVQNQTDEAMEVDVAIEAANLRLDGSGGQRVTVPANDRVEVRFPATTDDAGTARFRVASVSGDRADAAEIELPVYTPATSEAFATYGVVDDGAILQPVLPPADVYPQFGGLEISTSSTAVQSLTDAVLYLEDYPYETPDGLASRIIAIASLRDILAAFSAAGLPPADEIDARMAADIAQLAATQNDDGGWAWSRRGEPSEPFVTVDVLQALVAADAAGYDVPGETLDRALGFVAEIEQHYPSWYDDSIRHTISAFALGVRNQAGDRDPAKAAQLYERAGDELQLDAIAWLWPVLDDPALDAEIERTFQNAAIETPGAATFSADYGEDAYVIAHSDRRTDAIILDALITERPDSDLVPKIVSGLLADRVDGTGRWNNAYENSFILLAMHRYFETFEDVTPDFVARVWLGEQYVAEHSYSGRSTDSGVTIVPMVELVGGEPSDVVLQKDGAGRLYYRLGMDYAPDDLQLDTRDEGFVVDRTYEPVDEETDVVRDEDGTWRVRAGATVRVKVTMVADARRTNMALVDPLPAGLEPVNGSFANMTPPPDDPEERPEDLARSWCWCWRWFEHENLRDDRAEAYAAYLGAGTYEYTYTARATTPGTFVVPPATAEEIYAPEVFGRSASATVVVED